MSIQTTITQEKGTFLLQSMYQALISLITAWLDFKGHDIIIQHNNKPIAVLIPYEDYQILLQEDILADIREGREGQVLYEEWLDDPSTGIPYSQIRAELVDEGALDG